MEYKGPPRFVFLEFLDEEVNCVLHGLRNEFNSEDASSDIHITIQGPFYGEIKRSDLEHVQSVLEKEPILLDGFGIFSNDKEYVVYMKVQSPRLKDVWWKPDYPIEKFGFNPHISLYKGRNKKLAEMILQFLRDQNLKFLLRSFRVTQFASKQSELFPAEKPPRANQFLSLANKGLVKPNLLQKAANLVKAAASSS